MSTLMQQRICVCIFIIKGFEIQMKGPPLLNKNGKTIPTKSTSDGYHSIQQKPGSARSADIFPLDPNLTYRFRIIPKARLTDGPPSVIHRIGPGMKNIKASYVFQLE